MNPNNATKSTRQMIVKPSEIEWDKQNLTSWREITKKASDSTRINLYNLLFNNTLFLKSQMHNI